MASIYRVPDLNIKNEAAQIAAQLGMSLDAVINILLRQFVENKGFALPVRLNDVKLGPTAIDMSSAELEAACREAVTNREANPQLDYVTKLDEDGRIIKEYRDGMAEYVIL